jgi:hypothetical protein
VNTNHRRLFVVSGEAAANNNADAELLRVCLRSRQNSQSTKLHTASRLFSLFLVYTNTHAADESQSLTPSVTSRQTMIKQQSAIVLDSRSPQEIRSKPKQPTTRTAATQCKG